jgi:hypothetical protein
MSTPEEGPKLLEGTKESEPPRFTDDFMTVLEAERAKIEKQRERRGVADAGWPTTGLALSGGGIRSASFGLGVLQAFFNRCDHEPRCVAEEGHTSDEVHTERCAVDANHRSAFKRLDYLSTVSGGGFIGTALTWFLSHMEGRFPFSGKGTGGERALPGWEVSDYLRWHATYLSPKVARLRPGVGDAAEVTDTAQEEGFSLLSLLAVVGQMMIVTLFVYGGVLVLAFFLLDLIEDLLFPVKAILALYLRVPTSVVWLEAANFLFVVGLLLGFIYLLLAPATSIVKFLIKRLHLRKKKGAREFGLFTFFVYLIWGPVVYLFRMIMGRREGTLPSQFVHEREYAVRLLTERWAGYLAKTTLLALVVGSVPMLSMWISAWIEGTWVRGGLYGAVVAAGGGLGFVQHRRVANGTDRLSRVLRSGLTTKATAAVTLYGFLMLTQLIAAFIGDSGVVWVVWPLLGAVLLVGLLSDVNTLGSHGMYRDRLMETFMPDPAAVRRGVWDPPYEATARLLHESGSEWGPLQLHNASVLTTSSSNAKYSGRGADSFVLSPIYSGSQSTGWAMTERWPRRRLTVATAMAISAAAVNPGAATAGQGATRGWAVSNLLALLNLRLGFWADNPNPDYRPRWFTLPPALLRFGRWLRPYLALLEPPVGNPSREDDTYIQLADGGGFDGTGVYELVRRGTRVIVLSDAMSDQETTFGALGDVLERLWADFGIDVVFDRGEDDHHDEVYGLEAMKAGTSETGQESGAAKRGYAIGRFTYPMHCPIEHARGKPGVLLVLKAVMIDDVPLDVGGYKAANPLFPNDPTLDQFFDERQFEAYRKLGFTIAKGMLGDENVRPYMDDPGYGRTAERTGARQLLSAGESDQE